MSKVLDRVNDPSDLRGLTMSELEQLATEIRDELVKTVSVTGGHLASSLGAVELTIALHRVFESPRDKLIWDVGHQSYAHKLLTGRKSQFATLRQQGGISGFTSREESPHDPFGAGHASTSISAALGMATARDMAGASYHVVAIIGDGALAGGMAFEALNHTGHLGTRLIVVLNDNGMAISPSVGAVARALGRLRMDPRYLQAKREARHLFGRLPRGEALADISRRLKKGLKGLMFPTLLWEEMGFDYLGPVNGHDLFAMEEALRQARDYATGPTLIHVVTTKGKGYPPSESDCVGFHGVSPSTAKGKPAITYSEAFGRTVMQLLRQDPRTVAITAAMCDGTGLQAAAREFPQRVFDVGICEQHALTFAAGLAAQGFIPIVAIYSTFLQRAYDQIIHDICIQKLPVVLAIDRAGIVGDDGKTHQGAFDISYLCAIPNMVVAAPKNEEELQQLVYTATRANQPMAVRYPRGSGQGVPLKGELKELPLGKGEVLREGKDVVLLAIGSTVYPALEAAEKLSGRGIEATVANARFAKPLDRDLILSLASGCPRLVTVEENALAGGFGSSVLALLAESPVGTKAQVERIGLPDEFIEHGPQALLRARYDLDPQGIANRVITAFPLLKRGAASAWRGGGHNQKQ